MITSYISISDKTPINITFSGVTGHFYIEFGQFGEATVVIPSLKKLEELGFAIQAYLDEKTREKEKEDLVKEAEDLAEMSQIR